MEYRNFDRMVKRIVPLLIVLSAALVMINGCSRHKKADLVFLNGKIFTAKNNSNFVEGLAVKNGIIRAAGKSSQIKKWVSDSTNVIDLKGKLVLPGFHDAHLHFWGGAHLQSEINLVGTRSKAEVLERIRAAVKEKEPGQWIVGRGWDHELWPDKKLPTWRDLDRVSPKNPVFLTRVDGHAAWVNSVVLKMLRYNAWTPDPEGGKIVRFPHSNQPTGILLDGAFSILNNIVPDPTSIEKTDMLKSAIHYANSLGITSVTDNSPEDIFDIYVAILQDRQLTLRIHFWVNYKPNLDSLREHFDRFRVNSRLLSANLIKMFADGSLGSGSAYMLAPYRNDKDNLGLPQHSEDELLEMVRRADEKGWQVGIHAIGDAANRQVLDVYEKVSEKSPQPDRRFRIEHAQIVQPEDIARFARLGVIASMQPTHCISDMKWAETRIGDRVKYGYTWRSMLDNKVALAFGTDWPVELLNPLLGIYAAVTRSDTLGNPPGGWYPEQRLTVGEAVYAYTYGSAFAAKSERWQGRLMPGYVADLTVLDKDIFHIEPQEILRTRVLATYLGGREVFGDLSGN